MDDPELKKIFRNIEESLIVISVAVVAIAAMIGVLFLKEFHWL
jgi:hypothetical protein